MKVLWAIVAAQAAIGLLAQTPPPASFVTARMFQAATGYADPISYYGTEPYGIAVGDFNRDGKLDIIAACWGAAVTVNLGNGDGTFQSLSQVYDLPGAIAVAVGDFNQDGNLDAAVLAAGNPGSVAIFIGDGAGNLTETASYTVGIQGPGVYNNIAVGRLHGGGKLDLVVTNGNDSTVSVLLGNGDGTFQPQVAYSTTGAYPAGNYPQWVAIADVNKDGYLDLVTADSGQGISVLLGKGNGKFKAPVFYSDVLNNSGVGLGANGVAIADLNGDGNLDVVAAAQVGAVNVFMGNGDGTFQPAVAYSVPYASSIAIADLSGKPDLIVTDAGESTAWVLPGNGDGTFQPGVAYATDNGGQGIAVADFNQDGKLDFAVGSNIGPFVTVALGNGDGTFRAGTNYGFVEGYGVDQMVAARLGNDGNLDIVEADPNNRELHVMLGSSHGVLGAPSTISICGVPWWVAAGDVNGDGKLDIVAIGGANSGCGVGDNSVAVLLGNGNGTFQTPVYYSIGNDTTNNSSGAVVALAALTANRRLDIVVSNNDGSLSVLLNTGSGVFGAATVISGVTGTSEYILSGDFNGDGKLDLALPDYDNNTVKILLGKGNGAFRPPASVPDVPQGPGGLTVGDFNKDGNLDLAVTSNGAANGGGVAIFLGNGDGTFNFLANYGWDPGSVGLGAPATNPSAPVAVDVNADGNLDLLIPLANTHDWATCNCGIEIGNLGMVVLLGNGDGTFVDDSAGPFLAGPNSLQVVAGDFNNDGATDAAVLQRSGGSSAPFVTMLINNTQPVGASPLSLRYAAQTVGASSKSQTVILTNNQSTPLAISSVTVGGADPGDFPYKSACNATLPAGANCTIAVAFKPAATGSRTASLSIADAVGTQTVSLSGTGQ
ncbi:MAG TPA: FG-GAP-like repeat-containing protein [Bryobacteraceae bacterium]|nr:FG-GAP-like repeat-containing protein [Bryobacteraceae bacterium]